MTAKTCRHGETGYCHDDATPTQRDQAAFLHQHAWKYASGESGNRWQRDFAERFASWLVAQAWTGDGFDTDLILPTEMRRYVQETGDSPN